MPDEWKEKLGSTVYMQLPFSSRTAEVIDVLNYADKGRLIDRIDVIKKECESRNERTIPVSLRG